MLHQANVGYPEEMYCRSVMLGNPTELYNVHFSQARNRKKSSGPSFILLDSGAFSQLKYTVWIINLIIVPLSVRKRRVWSCGRVGGVRIPEKARRRGCEPGKGVCTRQPIHVPFAPACLHGGLVRFRIHSSPLLSISSLQILERASKVLDGGTHQAQLSVHTRPTLSSSRTLLKAQLDSSALGGGAALDDLTATATVYERVSALRDARAPSARG
ncbi:hypothetical protein C8R45DRAFT_970623 [Mycena sanguinolenta]|nr:hypothetical protein C8R45DRAFT_970623 [Mycena sanguinolenta]